MVFCVLLQFRDGDFQEVPWLPGFNYQHVSLFFSTKLTRPKEQHLKVPMLFAIFTQLCWRWCYFGGWGYLPTLWIEALSTMFILVLIHSIFEGFIAVFGSILTDSSFLCSVRAVFLLYWEFVSTTRPLLLKDEETSSEWSILNHKDYLFMLIFCL